MRVLPSVAVRENFDAHDAGDSDGGDGRDNDDDDGDDDDDDDDDSSMVMGMIKLVPTRNVHFDANALLAQETFKKRLTGQAMNNRLRIALQACIKKKRTLQGCSS
eukprot:67232-Pleurochrysis_carterae.AAC.1